MKQRITIRQYTHEVLERFVRFPAGLMGRVQKPREALHSLRLLKLLPILFQFEGGLEIGDGRPRAIG